MNQGHVLQTAGIEKDSLAKGPETCECFTGFHSSDAM